MNLKVLFKTLEGLGLEKDDIIGNMLFLKDDTTDEQAEILIKKLYEYITLKKELNETIDSSKISSYIEKLKVDMGLCRYQYLPFNMFVRFIGETNSDLKSGEIYQVAVVYCNDEDLIEEASYLVNVTENEQKEFDVSLFEKLQPSKVIFKGISGDNILHTGDLEIGKVYDVAKLVGNKIVFTNGKSCWDYEVHILEFTKQSTENEDKSNVDVKKEYTIEELIGEVKNVDNYFKEAVRYSIEYGGVSQSLLQRKFAMGYSRAARIIDRMEKFEFIKGFNNQKMREVIITPELFEKVFGEKFETKKD
ncbi:MAG: hypothetical protein IJA23_03220 [Clostridia bacterium]|nr:hypothetical protein [Clostridia bacterium]